MNLMSYFSKIKFFFFYLIILVDKHLAHYMEHGSICLSFMDTSQLAIIHKKNIIMELYMQEDLSVAF